MQHKRHRQPLEIESSLNVTNLLDTAFILLITFMLVAPQLTHGLKINLPDVDSGPVVDEPDKTIQILIEKRQEGEAEEWLYFQERGQEVRVTLAELEERLAHATATRPETAVVIQADAESRYEIFAKVIDTVKRAGVANIGLITEPTREED
ncbi:biopolymer transporter ExbD [bacterium]|nr:biopolymer transporter ExbD [bacterium]